MLWKKTLGVGLSRKSWSTVATGAPPVKCTLWTWDVGVGLGWRMRSLLVSALAAVMMPVVTFVESWVLVWFGSDMNVRKIVRI